MNIAEILKAAYLKWSNEPFIYEKENNEFEKESIHCLAEYNYLHKKNKTPISGDIIIILGGAPISEKQLETITSKIGVNNFKLIFDKHITGHASMEYAIRYYGSWGNGLSLYVYEIN